MEVRVIAYKFLREGRVAPFGGVRWPEPGEWLEVEVVDPCRSGIHACRPRDLPLWLGLGELWELELGGEVVEQERKVVASRGRLVRRVEGWDAAGAERFATACAEEAARLAAGSPPELQVYADDVVANVGKAPVAAYIVARLAEKVGGPDAYDAERRRQADWLAAALGL